MTSRLILAFALGVGAGFGYAPWSAPVLAMAAWVAWFWLLWRPTTSQPFWLGLSFGLGLVLITLRWISAIDISAAMALLGYQTLLYGVSAWLVARIGAKPWLAASAWFSVEVVNAYWPFGGFGWLRIGYIALDTPLALAYPVIGVAALSGLLLWWCAALAKMVSTPGWPEVAAATLALAVVLLTGLSLGPTTSTGTPVAVGWVQGGAPGGGIYGIGGPGETTHRHLDETGKLKAEIKSGAVPRPAFVVWPENGIDTDPVQNPVVGRQISQVVSELGTPLLFGGFAYAPRYTRSYWWTEAGPVTHYDKIHIVPFGEYVPLRDWLEPIFPLLKYVGEQSQAGTAPGLLDVSVADQELKVGTLVCFDVAYPKTAAALVAGGAELIVVQSSNAMFYGTAQISQQFAITRVRAAELQREILVVTTNGQSGLIGPDGSVTAAWPTKAGASGVVELHPSNQISLAAGAASYLEALFVLVLPIGGMVELVIRRKRRST